MEWESTEMGSLVGFPPSRLGEAMPLLRILFFYHNVAFSALHGMRQTVTFMTFEF